MCCSHASIQPRGAGLEGMHVNLIFIWIKAGFGWWDLDGSLCYLALWESNLGRDCVAFLDTWSSISVSLLASEKKPTPSKHKQPFFKGAPLQKS